MRGNTVDNGGGRWSKASGGADRIRGGRADSCLLVACADGIRKRPLTAVLWHYGLRISEALEVELCDVDLQAATIRVRRGLCRIRHSPARGDVYREVPLDGPSRVSLEGWLVERTERAVDGDACSRTPKRAGRPLAPSTSSSAGSPAERASHVLRNTCVTNAVRAGNDLVLVAELAGHRRLETTRRCSLPSAADRQAAMHALGIDD